MKREDFVFVHERPGYLEQLEKEAQALPVTDNRILLCFSCDPYPAEIDTSTTRETIKILHKYGHAVQILTKGGMRSTRDFDILGYKDAYAATLTLVDPELSSWEEPGAASPQERMKVLKIAHNDGIETWASLEPVLDPGQTLEIIRQTAGFVDLYKVGKLNNQKTMPADLKQLAKQIDWRKFAREVVDLLEQIGARYYIKDDLRAFLQEG